MKILCFKGENIGLLRWNLYKDRGQEKFSDAKISNSMLLNMGSSVSKRIACVGFKMLFYMLKDEK